MKYEELIIVTLNENADIDLIGMIKVALEKKKKPFRMIYVNNKLPLELVDDILKISGRSPDKFVVLYFSPRLDYLHAVNKTFLDNRKEPLMPQVLNVHSLFMATLNSILLSKNLETHQAARLAQFMMVGAVTAIINKNFTD